MILGSLRARAPAAFRETEIRWVRIFSTRLRVKDSNSLIASDLSGSIARG
jgi:hypothetical protein